MASKRGFGQIAKLPSGRYRARYSGPDLALHNAPTTFDNKMDAEAWLTDERRLISAGSWSSPAARRAEVQATEGAQVPLFHHYASRWIDERRVKGQPLAPRTRDHYRQLLDDYLAPTFGQTPLDTITPGAVNMWFDEFTPSRGRSHGKKTSGETARAHAYSFARAVMNTATGAHGPIVGHMNPFAVRGGGSSPKRRRDDHVATGAQLAVMLETIRPEWRALVLLGTWTGLRYSEIVALRRSDIDITKRLVRVRRSVTRSRSSGIGLKGPKSEAGVRDVYIPGHVLPDIKAHLRGNVTGRDGLLFSGPGGGFLAPATFYGKPNRMGTWYSARTAAGVPTLHFHDLRATGATLMAQLGATEAEIQAFLGDSTPAAAQRYVRAARSRMESLASKMSELAASGQW